MPDGTIILEVEDTPEAPPVLGYPMPAPKKPKRFGHGLVSDEQIEKELKKIKAGKDGLEIKIHNPAPESNHQDAQGEVPGELQEVEGKATVDAAKSVATDAPADIDTQTAQAKRKRKRKAPSDTESNGDGE